LNTTISVDQRRYNAPATKQVAAIWQDGSDENSKFKRSIMVYPNFGHPLFIRAYYGCYDPLVCPILYPGGETDWEDKSILLEETPIIGFPRARRKYTNRKTKGGNVAQATTTSASKKHAQASSKITRLVDDLCEDEGDCEDVAAEDGGGKRNGHCLQNITHLHVLLRGHLIVDRDGFVADFSIPSLCTDK